MNKDSLLNQKNVKRVGIVCGSFLVGWTTSSLAQTPTTLSQVNPCPGIYYDAPFKHRAIPPEGCPPNEAAIRRGVGGETLTEPLPLPQISTLPKVEVMQPPLPEVRNNAIASVISTEGQISLRLINQTNTLVTYQVVGETGERSLVSEEDTILLNLPLPVTITMFRRDHGFLSVTPISSQEGKLEVSLTENSTFGDTQGVIRVEEDGQVFLN